MQQDVVLFRFGLAFLAAMAFGLARQMLGKPIGFGTFIFVALGSCGLSLSALNLSPENPLPLLSAIVTGIGFLGAGALFRTGERVAGFTSAATIWIFAVFGLALGVGEYLVGGLVYSIVWIVSLIDNWLEKRWIGAHQRRLHVQVSLATSDEELAQLGLPKKSSALSIHVDKAQGTISLSYSVKRAFADSELLAKRLQASPNVLTLRIETI